MTGPCSGAVTGTPKPGFSLLQYVGPAAIGGALAGLSGWAGAAAGASIGALQYDLSTFCPTGPPAAPTFTIDDAVALLNITLDPAKLVAANKLRDIIGIVMWPLLCDCPSGTVTIDPVPSYPTDAPQQYPVVTSCASSAPPGWGVFDGTTGAGQGPENAVGPTLGVSGVFATRTPINGRLKTFTGLTTTAGNTVINRVKFYNAVEALISTLTFTDVSPYDRDYSFTVPVGTKWITFTEEYVHTSGSVYRQIGVDVWCGPTANLPLCGECPPDPSIIALLEQTLELVTIVQRQSAPFAYVFGAEHAGLTGSGSFDVFGLLGVRAQVDAMPDYTGLEDGNPVLIFDLGWIALGTADGWLPSQRVQHQQQLVLPPIGGLVTRVAYFLNPGVSISVTELRREF